MRPWRRGSRVGTAVQCTAASLQLPGSPDRFSSVRGCGRIEASLALADTAIDHPMVTAPHYRRRLAHRRRLLRLLQGGAKRVDVGHGCGSRARDGVDLHVLRLDDFAFEGREGVSVDVLRGL